MPIICFPWHSQVLQPHWHEIGSLMSCAKALNASGIICIQFQMRKSLIDVWPSNFLSSALGTFMSSCCISHYVVYIIFFLIWQFELLRRIFLEVKIKSGGYYRALAVASYREMSRVGHRILQISRYQIHLFLWSDFSKVLTHNSILLVIKCAFNSIVCIIKWLMVRVCVTTYAVVWF